MSNLFDPTPGQDYGLCKTCNKPIPTEDDKGKHWAGDGEGHSISILNQSRADRIERHIQQEIEDALQSAFSAIDDYLVRGHFTEEEVTKAMQTIHFEVDDGWREYSNE
ncbi:hypothetical protein [Glutamicibacter sp. M10]|uniref:hypothetical protein n=1 Tax=Glutamicibacter sp. M10 TaxID=3023076 RepID=UPI0021C7BE6B|nr:hypothetical protein [Glutamicibacter sp. M10]UXN30989.1 hypothetical protein N6V40_11205 [Glutamicibacter sp. M10]